jgi:hypothetical protein
LAFLTFRSVNSAVNFFKGVVHGLLRMHAYTCAHPVLKIGLDIANYDIVNSYGGGYNAWDVPETEFIKFQKV